MNESLVKIVGNFVQNRTNDFIDCVLVENDFEVLISNIPPKSARSFSNFCNNPTIKSFVQHDRKTNQIIEGHSIASDTQFKPKTQNYVINGNFHLTSDSLDVNSNSVIYVSTDRAYGYVHNGYTDYLNKIQRQFLFSMSFSSINKSCSLTLYCCPLYEVIHFDGTYEYKDNEYIFEYVSTETHNSYHLKISYALDDNDENQPKENEALSGIYNGIYSDMHFDLELKVFQNNIFSADLTYVESVRSSCVFGFFSSDLNEVYMVNETANPPEMFCAHKSWNFQFFFLDGFMTNGNHKEKFLMKRDHK